MIAEVLDRGTVFVRFAAMLATAQTEGHGFGVLAVRVGNLRRVMLGQGYEAGDRLLAEASARLASAARRRDWLARIGDQDFVLALPGIVDVGQLLLAANKLHNVCREPVQIGESIVPMHLTIGIAMYPQHGSQPPTLLHAAEQALARAEANGRPFEVCGDTLAGDDVLAWRIENLLPHAFDRGELELHYQPKIELTTGRIVGVEGLSRWTSRELGRVSPAVFVPIAERTQQITRLTWSTINTALQQLTAWASAGFRPSIAVNLSAAMLEQADLPARLVNALELWNVRGSCLTLEVTESAIMPNPERSFAMLREIRRLGVGVSIDDFGTGYSSLAYFRTLPADELKIDRSFVANLTTSAADRHLVRSVIDLAHRFELKVVAEGIEDAATARVLTEMGCDIGQGYHFARPVPADEVLARATSAEVSLEQ